MEKQVQYIFDLSTGFVSGWELEKHFLCETKCREDAVLGEIFHIDFEWLNSLKRDFKEHQQKK